MSRSPARWTLERDPYLLETSVPGVFACGDVRFSTVKRVASAVGEGSMAIAFVHQFLALQPPAVPAAGPGGGGAHRLTGRAVESGRRQRFTRIRAIWKPYGTGMETILRAKQSGLIR